MGRVYKQNGTSRSRLLVGACEVWGGTAEAAPGGVEVGERLWPGCGVGAWPRSPQVCVREGRQGMSPPLVCDDFPTLLKKQTPLSHHGDERPAGCRMQPHGLWEEASEASQGTLPAPDIQEGDHSNERPSPAGMLQAPDRQVQRKGESWEETAARHEPESAGRTQAGARLRELAVSEPQSGILVPRVKK